MLSVGTSFKATVRRESNSFIERNYDCIGDHGGTRFQIPTDLGDMAQYFRSLVAQDRTRHIPTEPRNRGELIQELSVDGECVQRTALALAYSQGGQADLVSLSRWRPVLASAHPNPSRARSSRWWKT